MGPPHPCLNPYTIIGVSLQVVDSNVEVIELYGSVDVCVMLVSSISVLQRDVIIRVTIEPGTM